MLWAVRRRVTPSTASQRRARFDEIDAELSALTGGSGPPHNEAGAIGWGSSWRMHSYLVMAEATGDPEYLHRLARTVDGVLDVRDSVRGVRDFRGRSLPVWGSAGRYTVVTATVPDLRGDPALEVRICPPHAFRATVVVTPDADGTFTLTVRRADPGRPETVLRGLDLDPAGARRADLVAYRQYTWQDGTTVRLLPGPESAGAAGTAGAADAARRQPRPGSYRVQPARVVLAAQTGMITFPMAGLARLARERPDLVPAGIVARVDDYLTAVHEALAVHEEQWRLSAEGEGYYTWLPDEPVSFAGAELPTNEFLAVGRTLVELAAVTGDREYVDRAVAMARTLRAQLRVEGGAFTWPYWPSFGHVYRGWQPTGDPETDVSRFRPGYRAVPRPEDVTHVLIDLDFARLYHATPALPPVFTDDDMRLLAGTFLRNVFRRRRGRPEVRRDVSGSGPTGEIRHQSHVGGWIFLRQWAGPVADAVAEVEHRRTPVSPQDVDAYCAALLARWG
ncbi:hypothetical protein O7626_02565 [Micromonospora sp. WMMD1102]|uniref:hypothetical protein n=1 Tax=Micromonospora sp. WMMD1102 TaxID=3016105 RepID=UPI002414E92E|nr:hypothetical protein [Micromonospora sp. WMMD1102]MDG4784825.1 hypothetical protein [Micromonospora sp. WMMD1102]